MRPQMRDTFSKAFREEAIRQVRESGEPLTKLRRLGRRRTNMRPPEGDPITPLRPLFRALESRPRYFGAASQSARRSSGASRPEQS